MNILIPTFEDTMRYGRVRFGRVHSHDHAHAECSLEGQASGHSRGLLGVRGAMMSTTEEKLPYDEEVAYLQSNTTDMQYVDLGLTVESDFVISGHTQYLGNVDYCCSGIGNYDGNTASGTTRIQSHGAYSGLKALFQSTVYNGPLFDYTVLVVRNTEIVWSMDYNSCTVSTPDAGTKTTGYNHRSDNGQTLKLFQDVITTTTGNPCKVWWIKIEQNGILVADIIPVAKDGVGYFYDRVRKVMLGNLGTGNLIIGRTA